MQYTRLGGTGLIVSRLAFGTMTFGSGEGAFSSVYKVDQQTATELVSRALDAGINFFNTADAYAGGQSETMLGKALGTRREQVVIATKVGNRMSDALIDWGLSRQHIIASAHASLKRLGTDYLDVYLLHLLDTHTPLDETLDAMESLVREGSVRYIGFSNWPAWLAAQSVGLQQARGWSRFRAAEMYYSLIGRDLEHEIVPFAQAAGIGIMVWSPLAGGFLTGKYTRENPQGGGGQLSGFDFIPFDREHGYTVVETLQTIAQAHSATPAQVALAWLLSRPHVASILVGASSVQQLNDNLGSASLTLSPDELQTLDTLTAPTPVYPNWFNAKIFDPKVQEALNPGSQR